MNIRIVGIFRQKHYKHLKKLAEQTNCVLRIMNSPGEKYDEFGLNFTVLEGEYRLIITGNQDSLAVFDQKCRHFLKTQKR